MEGGCGKRTERRRHHDQTASIRGRFGAQYTIAFVIREIAIKHGVLDSWSDQIAFVGDLMNISTHSNNNSRGSLLGPLTKRTTCNAERGSAHRSIGPEAQNAGFKMRGQASGSMRVQQENNYFRAKCRQDGILL